MSKTYSVRMSNDLNDSQQLLLTPAQSTTERLPEMYYITSNNDAQTWLKPVNYNYDATVVRPELYHISSIQDNKIPKLSHAAEYEINTNNVTTTSQGSIFQGNTSLISSSLRTTNKKRLTVSFNLAPEYNECHPSVKAGSVPVELNDVPVSVGFVPIA